jgi:hypothetical protein
MRSLLAPASTLRSAGSNFKRLREHGSRAALTVAMFSAQSRAPGRSRGTAPVRGLRSVALGPSKLATRPMARSTRPLARHGDAILFIDPQNRARSAGEGHYISPSPGADRRAATHAPAPALSVDIIERAIKHIKDREFTIALCAGAAPPRVERGRCKGTSVDKYRTALAALIRVESTQLPPAGRPHNPVGAVAPRRRGGGQCTARLAADEDLPRRRVHWVRNASSGAAPRYHLPRRRRGVLTRRAPWRGSGRGARDARLSRRARAASS